MPPCQLLWYDGGCYPPREVGEVAQGQEYPDNGMIVVGDKGKLSVYGVGPRLLPEKKMKDFKRPAPSIPRCESDHFREWVTACKGGRAAFSNFDHAGPLTEFVLLGNMAIRAGKDRHSRMGRPEHEVYEHARVEPVCKTGVPQRLDTVIEGE